MMSALPQEPFQPPLLPSAVICCALINGSAGLVTPFVLAVLLQGVVLAWYSSYVLGCMRQICNHLGIRAFHIQVLPLADKAK